MDSIRFITGQRVYDRALGCLYGHILGAAMAGNVFPARTTTVPRLRLDHTLAGEPQGDELLLLQLARVLISGHQDNMNEVIASYMASEECGTPLTMNGLCSQPVACPPATAQSCVLSPLMRMPPLGIWGTYRSLTEVARIARQDARFTPPHPVCSDATAVYAVALALALALVSSC